MTISIIIPVFNEEAQIEGCLQSIAEQTVLPDEVIVVDNNCTDKTIELASKFPFVKVINEKKQGRAHARNAGFNAAKGVIIGRIDADSRLEKHWVERVKKHFNDNDELVGLTGLGKTAYLPFVNSLKSTLFCRSYYWFVHTKFRTITMWGANMALRKSAWSTVADKVVNDDLLVHEDQDVSLWIAATGGKITQTEDVLIYTNGQEYRYLPKLLHYGNLFRSTRRIHRTNGNLAKVPNKSSFKDLLFGYLLSMVIGCYMILVSIIFYPLDYILIKAKLANKRMS
jgi:glycosyltransferase involved in cell wall biosynthesis